MGFIFGRAWSAQWPVSDNSAIKRPAKGNLIEHSVNRARLPDVELQGLGRQAFVAKAAGGLFRFFHVDVGNKDGQPSRASCSAIAAPMPIAAPVTRATFE